MPTPCVDLKRNSSSPPEDKAASAVFYIQDNVLSSAIITSGLLHSQQKSKAWDESNHCSLSQANMAQGLGNLAPVASGVGSGDIFSHRVAQCLGHLRRYFCCRNTEWGWVILWVSPASSGLPCCRVVLVGHWPRSSPEKQTASTTKNICVQPSMCCEVSIQEGIKCIWKYHCNGESAMLICRKALLLSTARRDIFLLLIRQKNIICAAVPENSFSTLPCCFPLR